MPILPEKNVGKADQTHVCDSAESAHYLRQATITLRRHSSRLNYVWCKNLRAPEAPKPWKH